MYLMTSKYTTNVGGIAAPFGEMMIASDNGTNYSLGKESGYATASNYYTLLFSTSGVDAKSIADTIAINMAIPRSGCNKTRNKTVPTTKLQGKNP